MLVPMCECESGSPTARMGRATADTGGDSGTASHLSPCGLGWAHIFGQSVTVEDGAEALESVAHGDGSMGFVAGVAGPAAETSDGPGGPCEAMGRMGVLLFLCAALKLRLQ